MKKIDTSKLLTNYQFTIPLLFLFLYLLFPTQNSSTDGFGYANYIKEGEKLFLSHHLLYNFFGYLWNNLIGLLIYIDTLSSLKIMNSVFAASSVFVLINILKTLKINSEKVAVWAIFVGGSWGLMRFATENETYIIPIFFSLLSSLFFQKFIEHKRIKSIVISGFLAALACLFHQIHMFWWLAILISLLYTKDFKSTIYYTLPALLVPIVYIFVFKNYYNNPFSINGLIEFTLRDFYSGTATVSLGAKSIMFVGISFVRTFFQVHGYIANYIRLNPWLIVIVLSTITLLLISLINIFKIRINKRSIKSITFIAYSLAFLMHLGFAFLSHGNAEFMIMLPFLLAIALTVGLENELKAVGFIALAMMLWNTSFGIIPLNKHQLDGNKMTTNKIIENNRYGHTSKYVLFNKPAIDNRVRYYLGEFPDNSLSINQEQMFLKKIIDKSLDDGLRVYTDCVFRPKTLSRESMTTNFNPDLFLEYHLIKTDSTSTLSGIFYLVEINKKQE